MQNKERKESDIKTRSDIYALDIIKFLDNIDKKDITTQIIAKQLVRSATSIGANIIEAQAGSSRKDFTNFLSYSLKSANESKFWLGLLRDSKKSDKVRTELLLKETSELASILGSSIIRLKKG